MFPLALFWFQKLQTCVLKSNLTSIECIFPAAPILQARESTSWAYEQGSPDPSHHWFHVRKPSSPLCVA